MTFQSYNILGFHLFDETERELFQVEFLKNIDEHTVELGARFALHDRLQKLPSSSVHLAVKRRRYSELKHTDSLYLARIDFVRMVHLPFDLSLSVPQTLDRVRLHYVKVHVLGSDYSSLELVGTPFKWLLDPPHNLLDSAPSASRPLVGVAADEEPF